MGMFDSMRKSRGFNHQYIYADERKEKFAKIEGSARHDLGMLLERESSPGDTRGKFAGGITHLKGRKVSGRKPASFGIILIIIVFLLYLWHYLVTGGWSF